MQQLRHFQNTSFASLRGCSRVQVSNLRVAAATAEPLYDIYVKGQPEEGLVCERGELGDCELITFR